MSLQKKASSCAVTRFCQLRVRNLMDCTWEMLKML